jgi:hypothetical protein
MLVFPTQECLKDLLIQKNINKYNSEFYASIMSGLLVSLVGTPINVIKTPLQSCHNNKIFPVIKIVYNQYGLKGFYRGGLSTLLRDVSWNSIYFPLYKYINEKSCLAIAGSSFLSLTCCLSDDRIFM